MTDEKANALLRSLGTSLLFLLSAMAQAAGVERPEIVIQRFLQQQTQHILGRVTISVDPFDPRGQLAPCDRAEPFLPPGAKLWDRVTVGVRCLEGANWTVYRGARLRAYGPAVVAARSMPAGQVLGEADYRIAEVELTQFTGGVITDPAELYERQLVRPVTAGQALRRELVRARTVIAQGDPVKLAYVGMGFVVHADGKALASAGEGDRIRVQADTGRVLTGVVRAGRLVEVSF